VSEPYGSAGRYFAVNISCNYELVLTLQSMLAAAAAAAAAEAQVTTVQQECSMGTQ
jgi:hypothetical protein